MKIHRAGVDAIKIAWRWAGCPQVPCFHTDCAVHAQTFGTVTITVPLAELLLDAERQSKL